MLTLSYGYKKPQNSDTGDVVFPAMEQNIQQMNDHQHNGVDSALLTSSTNSTGIWSAAPIGGGLYRTLMTVPAGYSLNSCEMWFKTAAGATIYPSIEQVSSTTYYLYCNDNTLVINAYYR
jgi:hypothetical protein